MAKTSRFLALWLLLAVAASPAMGQSANLTDEDLRAYEQRSRDLVSFLQFMLNTVGAQATSARDKEVIITQSFQKIFRDAQVQIEDDLLTDRLVVINKSVPAYFKDVDFFFRHVQFEFNIVKVEALKRENGQWYFKIETDRNLKGVGIEGEQVTNTRKRFIEVNLDVDKDDLKIASIYTTKVSREKALRAWWSSLSFEWTSVLEANAGIVATDSLDPEQLASIAALDSLDLTDNRLLQDIEPLEMLSGLVYLKLTNSRIDDLSPLRGLSELRYLDISSTGVSDISFLKYSEKIEVLYAANTAIYDLTDLQELSALLRLSLKGVPATDFSVLGKLTRLQQLDLSSTGFTETGILASLTSLEQLQIAATPVSTLEGLEPLKSLRELNASETFVRELGPLRTLNRLQLLRIDDTPVASLGPLMGIPSLERVFCDNSSVTDKHADDFMAQKKKTIVVMNSRQLEAWWGGLAGEWHMALSSAMGLGRGARPSKEQLVKLVNTDSLSLVGKGLSSLLALERFRKLTYLDISKNPVTELIALSRLGNLKTLKANETPVESLLALKGLASLEKLELIDTKVYDLEPLSSIPKLSHVNVDDTFVSIGSVVAFLRTHPDCVVIFKTKELQAWWQALPGEWQQVFRKNNSLSVEPTGTELHQLIAAATIDASGISLSSLAPLFTFLELKELDVSQTGLSSLHEVAKLDHLQGLDISKNPIESLSPIQGLLKLKRLNVSNTAVSDLREIEYLRELEVLNCAGTQLKNLKGIEKFVRLKEIDFSNTKVGRLDRLVDIQGVQKLVCFNTRVSSREVDGFRERYPDCKVTYY